MSVVSREELVLRGVQPVGDRSKVLNALQGSKPASVLWCPPVGQPHLGSLAHLNKIADFLQAGLHVKVLLTDGPSLLETLHISAELAKTRAEFRQRVLTAALKSVGAPAADGQLSFVSGLPGSSELDRSGDWTMGLFSLASVTARDAARTAADGLLVSPKNAPLSELVLPIIQAVDEQALQVDLHYGREEQASSFAFAETALSPVDRPTAGHIVSPSVPDFFRASATATVDSSIYFHDSPKKKINTAFAEEGTVEGNGLLVFLRTVVLPISARLAGQTPFVTLDAPANTLFTIKRDEKYGGPLHFESADAIEAAYSSKALHPKDLKSGVLDAANVLLLPVQEAFGGQAQLKTAADAAYPAPVKVAAPSKKDKKAKKAAPAQAVETVPAVSAQEVEARIALITRGLFDDGLQAGGTAAMAKVLSEGRQLRLYWGTATTGRPHIGYFVPLTKIADFLKAGIHVKVLLADVHGFLDNLKAPIALVRRRTEYYSRVIRAALKSIGVQTESLEFVVGSSYQTSHAYTTDVLRITDLMSEHDAKKSGADVVKQSEKPPLSGLIYPLMQALDEQYLGVDVQFGGVDQRKIFTMAQEALPKLGYAERSHLMNSMIPGLQGGKMSSSEKDSKIDFLDGPQVVNAKLATAACDPAQPVEGNGLLAFARAVLFPVAELRRSLNAPVPYADSPSALLTVGSTHFSTSAALEQAFVSGQVSPDEIRTAVAGAINHLLEPILAEFEADAAFREIETAAYPTPAAEKLANGVADIKLVDAAL